MEEKNLISLKRELKLKKIQFNSIYEFSESIYTSFEIDNIIRIFFSTLLGQMGISRAFFFHSEFKIFRRRGFKFSEEETTTFNNKISKIEKDWFYLKVEDLPEELEDLKEILIQKKIHSLINISESKKNRIILGLGLKFNKIEISSENIEFSFFLSKFALIAIENAALIKKMIENKRMEHELQIAKGIQLSLLPQKIPELNNFELSIIYEPLNEVGGDYYDIFKVKDGMLPILIADVEGKGLPAALLAASSQAVIHSLNELYIQEPAKFISKANSLICDFTRGDRFITLFWMLLDDRKKSVTYVNAGHVEPFLISGKDTINLSKGGFLTGFVETAMYEKEKVVLKSGDILAAFTDGVPEAENPEGEEYGEQRMIDYFRKNRHLSTKEMADGLFLNIKEFCRKQRFRDDFTLILLKAK